SPPTSCGDLSQRERMREGNKKSAGASGLSPSPLWGEGARRAGEGATDAQQKRRGTNRDEDPVQPDFSSREGGLRLGWPLCLAFARAFVMWVAATLAAAAWLPGMRPAGYPPPALPWMAWAALGVPLAWGLAGLGILFYWLRRGRLFPLGTTILGLAGSA